MILPLEKGGINFHTEVKLTQTSNYMYLFVFNAFTDTYGDSNITLNEVYSGNCDFTV